MFEGPLFDIRKGAGQLFQFPHLFDALYTYLRYFHPKIALSHDFTLEKQRIKRESSAMLLKHHT